jgi:hypothetical protein
MPEDDVRCTHLSQRNLMNYFPLTTEQGYRFKPGHSVISITCRDGLTTLPGQRQLVDLR